MDLSSRRRAWNWRFAAIGIGSTIGAVLAAAAGRDSHVSGWPLGFAPLFTMGAIVVGVPVTLLALLCKRPIGVQCLMLVAWSLVLSFSALEPPIESTAARRHEARLVTAIEELAVRVEQAAADRSHPLDSDEFQALSGGGCLEDEEVRYDVNADGTFELRYHSSLFAMRVFDSKTHEWWLDD